MTIKQLFSSIYDRKPGVCVVICTALVVIILSVYIQTADHPFLNLDDDVYVTHNTHVISGITHMD